MRAGKPRDFLRRHRVTVASWTALATVSAVLVAYAVNADGYPVHKAELNDGGIWITNQSMGAVGRQNVPLAQIDGRVFDGQQFTSRPSLDVLQDGSAVISVDRAANTLMPVDVAMATGLDDQKITAGGSAPLFGGGSLGVLDPATGKLWSTTVDPDSGTSPLSGLTSESRPVAKIGGSSVGAASVDGTLFAASTDSGETVTLRRTEGGAGFGKPVTDKLGADLVGKLSAMTAVGDEPVVVDDKGNVATFGQRLANVGDGAMLQQPGPEAADVLVATRTDLLAVAVQGGARRTVAKIPAAGDPAAPVSMPNGCAFAAWSGGAVGTLVSACGDEKPKVANFAIEDGAELVFRVNRNQVILNDQKTGMAWTVTSSQPEEISNWEAFQEQTEQKDDKNAHKTEAQTTQPPQAEDDELGARDGRTTVLNVLDNDLIASDGILSIVAVKGVTRDDVQVEIAPDRQSLLATVSPGVGGSVSFRYTIDDGTQGKTSQDDGSVTLKIHNDAGSGKPQLRQNTKDTTYNVAAGSVIEFAVTPDWRDYDYGDPIVVQSVKSSGNAKVSTTALGLIRFEAPVGTKGGIQTVSYTVSTGGEEVPGQAHVNVVPAGTQTVPAQPQSDVVSGEVGGPITVRPLDNDIPGADGSDAGSKLTLAGRVAPTGGLDVDTDLESGKVTVTGTQPGTYFLDYRAGFGAAPRADGQIRVDITPASPDGDKPVATPDVTAVHGLSPITVDVLANDFDPRGKMLVVQQAEPSNPDSQLEVAVIDGRWVRVSATDAEMSPKSQSVTYTISNGSATAKGSINVTQRPALTGAANAPIPQTDRITVRAGDTAAAPVLDNDSTPSGDPVGLVLDPSVKDLGQAIGELRVLPAVGTAYVAGRQVRFVAPEKVNGPTDVDVQYVVENTGDPTAETAVGTLKVHITPPVSTTNPNLDPTPRALDGRVTQGDLLTLKLPPTGSDPDGDSVAVTGVATAPKLGRILAFGANSLTYQAYPDASGTDEFTYEVTDPYGATAIGHVRVGVVQAGAPQAPVAVNDSLIADPDRTVEVDALVNDLRTPGTRVRILPLEDTGKDVRLRSDTGPVSVDAPEHGASRNVVYEITNGLDESRAVVTVTGQDGYNNPPVTRDLYASPKPGAATVEVDVLKAVRDVDGPDNKLKLDAVTGVETDPDGKKQGPTIHGGKVVIPVKNVAQVLAYRVLDGDGAAAAAAIYVPAKPTGAPYLKPGYSIQMKPGQTLTKDLSEMVEDPEGDPVVLTTVEGISASPVDRLSVAGKDKDTLSVTATDKEGPGSIVFEVSDRAKLTDPEAHTSFISVPVQVGEENPVINCPSEAVDVPEGGVSKTIDIASVCHVWTADPRDAGDLSFSASWRQQPNDVEVKGTDRGVQLIAGSGAHRGDTGVVSIGAKGFAATGQLSVRVVALPPPTMAPIRLDTEATKSVSVDISPYLTSPLPSSTRKVKVMAVVPTPGATAPFTVEGSKVTFTPKADTDGVMRYRLQVSDVGGSTTSGRPFAAGIVTLAVVARPDAPANLAAGQEMLSNTVALTWTTPDNNGKRIDGYEVKYSGPSSGTFKCSGSPCRVTGLKNGDEYTFTVRAHNATAQNGGWSEPSNVAKATPDAFTGPVQNLRVTLQRDNRIHIAWNPPAPCDCSAVQKYRISWPGGGNQERSADTREMDIVPAPNGDNITVTVVPLNKKGVQENTGPVTTVVGMGAGKPNPPAAPTLSPTNRPGNASKAIGVSWSAVGANGPAPVSYQVQRSGGAGTRVVCAWTTATSCNDEVTNDGTIYTYAVQAKNAEADSSREQAAGGAGEHISAYGSGKQIEASAPPNAPQITSLTPTGANGQASITFNVGASHGTSNTVTCSSSAGACGTWTFPNGGASGQTRTLSGFSNGSTTNVTLRACNGGQANLCTNSNTMGVITYGPIPAPSITAASKNPAPGDNTTSWSMSGNANGAPIRWVVTSSATGRSWSGNSGNTGYSSSGVETLPYNTNVRYTVTVTDASGHGRSSASDSDTAATGGPNLSVSVSKGTSCSYSGCTGAIDPCNGTCWYIKITTSGFSGNVGCTYRAASDGHQIGNSTWTQGGNQTRESFWWAGDPNSFYINCVNGSESARSPNAW